MTESICDEDPCHMETMASQYDTNLRKIMDDHAPEKTETEKRSRMCLGTKMKPKVSNLTEGRPDDEGCNTEVIP